MDRVNDFKCRVCLGQLMPLWKSTNWFCTECKLEQNLPKEPKEVDNWDK
jgi:hypothetical protein